MKEMKFEDKMKELEKIIDELESGNVDLDDSIDKYTKAMTLIKECDEKLKNIEEKVTKMVSDSGELEEFSELDVKE